jgi:hypothetical protein
MNEGRAFRAALLATGLGEYSIGHLVLRLAPAHVDWVYLTGEEIIACSADWHSVSTSRW